MDLSKTATTPVLKGPDLPRGQPVPTLSIVLHESRGRIGERVHVRSGELPLDRASAVFPGGPLADPQLSRVHARVVGGASGGVEIQDLGSKNGTFVNGDALARGGRALACGDVVRLGSTLVLFHETEAVRPPQAAVEGIVGESDSVRDLRLAIIRYASSAAPVLVLGESGTGKELVGTSIGKLGRPRKPVVAFNAAALTPTLVDSTLFGHVRGAFTDAREDREGLFQRADNGTLFLDEVGDLPPEIQVRLLRALEERQVTPLGSTRAVQVDVRVVAATNRDLAAEVAAGRFRGDLYARLAYLTVSVPPLRERLEDVSTLALFFAPGRTLTARAMTHLLRHPWPFNIRELKACVAQAVADSPGDGPLELPPEVLDRLARHADLFKTRQSGTAGGSAPDEAPATGRGRKAATAEEPAIDLDEEAVKQALAKHHGNVSRAAAEVGRDRANFYRTLRRMGIDPSEYR